MEMNPSYRKKQVTTLPFPRQEGGEPLFLQQVAYPRGLGIILPVFSLPSPYGIGSFGEAAYRFIHFLQDAGVHYWQILPLGPTGHNRYHDSPYSSFSSFAGNPYFIDLDQLAGEGLLDKQALEALDWGQDPRRVDYSAISRNRFRLLQQAFDVSQGREREEEEGFYRENQDWLEDYALFMAIKRAFYGAPWMEWPEGLKRRDPDALAHFARQHQDSLHFQKYLQFKFFQQWYALKRAANEANIAIIGDLPIYPALDSADVWAHTADFQLDGELKPVNLAGCPPDYFSQEGQLWGNPIYDWEAIRGRDYGFALNRLRAQLQLYDILRLDHFIGYVHYWSVGAGEKTARNGRWNPGPGKAFFQRLEELCGPLPIIVEDLGDVDESVIALREASGFPGMKPLEFAWGEENSPYLPHRFDRRSCAYSSTHDQETLRGWWEGADMMTKERAAHYFGLNESEGAVAGLMRGLAASVADFCIFQMQDVLEIDNEGRINTPGSLGNNWSWRMGQEYFDRKRIADLRQLAELYGRNEWTLGNFSKH